MRRWGSTLLLATLLLAHAAEAEAQQSRPVYLVQPGDTLYDIALRFGTSIEALMEANHIADPALIYPGMEVTIPGFEGIRGVLTTREIAYGESLASLSVRNGIPRDTIVRLNRLVNPGRLYVGQSVIVPVDEASPLALGQARVILPSAGESLLELAVRSNLQPWSLATLNGHSERLWIVPGAVVALPGGTVPTISLPEPVESIVVSPLRAVQGHTTEVKVTLLEPAALEGRFGPWALHFNTSGELERVALQGVHAMAEAGLYDLEVRVEPSAAGEAPFTFVQPMPVYEGGYPADPPLRVPPETVDPAVTVPEEELVASIVGNVTPERLWSGVFQFPSPYTEAFPSRFGSRRSYNGSAYLYYHTGLDFYGGTGTAILAPAPGRVVFAGPLTVRGNTTIIDHGWGIFTSYLHQSEILVSAGDTVQPGQTIGLVGATGRVTGAHLHWDVWVGGNPVDPLEWISVEFP